MPVASEAAKRAALVPDHELLRLVECTAGEVRLQLVFQPRAAYGAAPVRVRPRGRLGLRMEVGGGVYWLRGTHDLDCAEDRAWSDLNLRDGQSAQFSLTYSSDAPAVLGCLGEAARARLAESRRWWCDWADRATYDGPHCAAVRRSALALKLLTYAPSGAMVAAPTTSLPERVGAGLNWDYRYCWLRDASFTVRALAGLGYWEEAEAFLNWLLFATWLTQPELRVMYTVFGETPPPERTLSHLRGFRDSPPVRIGNGARGQLQLDVYGEVIDAVAQFASHGRRFDRPTQRVLLRFGEYVRTHWHLPDEGLWEPRSGPRPHTHSRLLCWTALDRLCTMIDQGVIERAVAAPFHAAAEAIRHDIVTNAWNARLESYTSVLGGDTLDASLLLMSWYGFETADSPRMRATHAAIARDLRAGPALLYRYRRDPPEGAFGICGFWEVEYLARGGGSVEQAATALEQLLSHMNDVGLMAEETDPDTGAALGNFPQAFTHVGLINAALSLQARRQGAPTLVHRAASAVPNPSRSHP